MKSIMDDARIKLPEQVYMRDPGTELATSAPMKQITNNQLQQSEDPSTGLEIEPHPILIGHQQSLCKGLSAHDGPLIRKTDIRKIPLEIWTNVAKYVRGDFDSPGVQYHTSGVNDVKNLRLTCTQLCAASSCHLLYRLDVLLTNTSMKQFEDVSQHPTISQGVQAFHVILRNPISARSLKDFIRQVLVMLQEAQDQDSSQFQQHTDLFEPILLSCTNYLQAEALRPYKDKNTIALCEFYEDYIHLIKEQEALLESGTFATRVGKAVARMPRATGLFIDERGTYDLGHLPFRVSRQIKQLLLLVDEMASPLPQQAANLLYQLPVEISRAGNRLKQVHISLQWTTEYEFVLSKEQTQALVHATKDLEVVDIDCLITMKGFQIKQPSYERLSLSAFTGLLSNSTQLTSATLRFNVPEADQEVQDLNAGPLLAMLPWANLKEIILDRASVHYCDLAGHIQKLSRRTYIHLGKVYLLSGSWANLLDELRKKADDTSIVGELDGNDDWELVHIFEHWYTAENPATAYIRGEISENPLRLP